MTDPAELDTSADATDKLKDLNTRANHAYASKRYSDAADLYSEATTIQASINGEMAPQNADLLYAYGRCLFHLGVGKSDVLGGKVAAGEERVAGAKAGRKRKREHETASVAAQQRDEVIVEKAVDSTKAAKAQEQTKPFFQITGDDQDWEDESGSDDDAQADDEEDEEDDDLATAYEILDVARVLFGKQIEEMSNASKGKAKVSKESPEMINARHSKELLADTHDLQAEISLENERFTDAISDSRASLALKEELYDNDNGQVAEAHYKLSLALEFASVTVQSDAEKLANPEGEPQVDEVMRKEAASEMEAAIECTKLRLDSGSKTLAALAGQELQERRKDMEEIKEIISDMEQRLEDLRNPAVSLDGIDGVASGEGDLNPLGSILRGALGESSEAQKSRIEQAKQGANDLSGIVRRQKPKAKDGTTELETPAANGQIKRKAWDENTSAAGKRARTEDLS